PRQAARLAQHPIRPHNPGTSYIRFRQLLVLVLVLSGIRGADLQSVTAPHAKRFDRPDATLALPALASQESRSDGDVADPVPGLVEGTRRPKAHRSYRIIALSVHAAVRMARRFARRWQARAPPPLSVIEAGT
ncbi:MAG: hypothetical protein ACOC1F_13470, partial [Myxococcota bacterium]